MLDFQTILFALSGGLLPALIWLTFWLREDSIHPEPKKFIFLTFIFGIISAPVALAFQLLINKTFFFDTNIQSYIESGAALPLTTISMIIIWATIEEICKYKAAHHGGLKRSENDEAVDDMIYMIAAALGFASIENALYVFGPLLVGDTELAIATGNLRFIGASLLHIATASIIGASRAFSHFHTNEVKKRYILSGFILAVALHSAFNLFIINNAERTFTAFSIVWIIIIIIILIFERVKRIYVERIK
jgi:RsiW-degrading membrane proteinase PrsW (M82 family)